MAQSFGALIEQGMRAKALRAYDLAYRMGKQPSYVSRLVNGEYKGTPPPNELAALERELGISQAAMLEALGYNITTEELRDLLTDSRLIEVIRDWDDLTPTEREWIFGALLDNRERRERLRRSRSTVQPEKDRQAQ